MMSILRRRLVVLLVFALFLELDPASIVLNGSPTSEAFARIGRPATPMSVAGVARRTTRRCVTGVYNC